MAFFDLLQRIGIVIRCHWYVSTVEDLAPEVEGVALEWSEEVSRRDDMVRLSLTHYIRR